MIKQNRVLNLGYMVFLSILTFGFWFLKIEEIGMISFAIATMIFLIFFDNTSYALPYIFNMFFMISRTEWSLSTIPIYIYILPIILILGFIVHIIRYKPIFNLGKLGLPLLLLFLAIVLSMINVKEITINYLFYCLIGIFYLFTYFFFRSTLKGDNLLILLKLFVISGVLISIQVLVFYLRVDDLALALESKNLDLGWGISNFIATYLIIFISATFYYIKKNKFHFLLIILAIFEIIALYFTLSRGGIMAIILTLPFLIYYLFYGYEKKFSLFLNILISLTIFAFIIYFLRDYFVLIWNRVTKSFFADNGRFDLWEEAIILFKSYPLFGAGLFARVEGDYFGFYHNTFIHTAATLGIVGLISILWQIINVFKLFFKNLNFEKAILLIALFGANIHGMVDNVYYMPQFMVIFFIVIAAVENHDIENLEAI
ncbi:MAG: O-antigen ligase family protein [Candidatus Izemoplasmatales bacterium]